MMRAMKRRAFLSALGLVGVPAAAIAQQPELIWCDPCDKRHLPYEQVAAYCPTCGDQMMIVTRRREMATHDSPRVWSCGRCQRSYRIAPTRIAADAVPYDDGTR